MRAWMAILFVPLVLAGCSGDDSSDAIPTEADCQEQGLELQTLNGTLACGPLRPPATVLLQGLPAVSSAFVEVAFQWQLDTHKPQNHAMLTEVRVATEPVADAALAGPDSFGASVAKMEHQDFLPGQAYDAAYRPEAPGTYYLRAYALVEGQDLWSAQATLNVTAVEATGTVHDVTLPPGSALHGPDPETVTAALGDGVRFVNDDAIPRTIVFTGPAEVGPVTAAQLATSEAVVFLVPGTYAYTSGESAGAVTGSVTVPLP